MHNSSCDTASLSDTFPAVRVILKSLVEWFSRLSTLADNVLANIGEMDFFICDE